MKLYWSHSSLPELAHLTKKERSDIWRAAYVDSFASWRVWLSWGLFVLLFALGFGVSYTYGANRSSELLKMGIAGAVALAVAWPFILASVRPFIRAEAERRVRERSSNKSLERTRD